MFSNCQPGFFLSGIWWVGTCGFRVCPLGVTGDSECTVSVII